MKKIVVVLVSLVVAVLIDVGDAISLPHPYEPPIPEPSLGPNWRLAYILPGNGTTDYFNTRSIVYLPGGIVKVLILEVPRGWIRWMTVSLLKGSLRLKGEDPNDAERLWYYTDLEKIDCKKHQDATLEYTYYSFEQAVLNDESYKHEDWYNIRPGGAKEAVEKYVCKEAPSSIPAPSLSSKWKLLGRDSNLTLFYINTRKITYLPNGIVKVWELWVPRGEDRREIVNILKRHLHFKGEDPSYAERLWYYIELAKVNCKTHQYAKLKVVDYSFGQATLDDESFQPEVWKDIIPRSLGEIEEKYVCK